MFRSQKEADTSAQLRQKVEALRAELEQLNLDHQEGLRYLDLIKNDIVAIENSLTWKIGAGVTKILRTILGKGSDPQAADHLREVLRAIEKWRGEHFARTPGPETAMTYYRTLPVSPSINEKPLKVGLWVPLRLDGKPNGSAYIRLIQPLKHLRCDVTLFNSADSLSTGFDVVIVQRTAVPDNRQLQALHNRLQRFQIPLILDLDDDLLSDNYAVKAQYSPESLAVFAELLSQADGVVCASDVLQQRYNSLNPNITVIKNGIDPDLWPAVRAGQTNPDVCRAVYIATPTHHKDLLWFKPVYKALKKQFGEAFELDIIGASDKKIGFGNTISIPPGVTHYPDFLQWLGSQNCWEIGIAPLQKTRFNAAKSHIKLLDYSMLNLAVVASDIDAYQTFAREESSVLLCGDDHQAWQESMSKLLQDSAFRNKQKRTLQQHVNERYTVAHAANAWNFALDELIAQHRQQRQMDDHALNVAAYTYQNPDTPEDEAQAQLHFEHTGRKQILSGTREYYPAMTAVDTGFRQLQGEQIESYQSRLKTLELEPLFSIIVPIYKVSVGYLQACVESVMRQVYGHWQLILIDDFSDDSNISEFLATLNDPRITTVHLRQNLGISGASNAGITKASGDYIVLLDHDDELAPHALAEVAIAVDSENSDILFSDEAKIDLHGNIVDPHYKPAFSPEHVLSQNYISHLGVYRKSIVDTVGGFREGFEGAQDYDLLLRVLNRADVVTHIPKILYFWRKIPGSTAQSFSEKSYAWDAGEHALKDALQMANSDATVSKGQRPGTFRITYPVDPAQKISVIIPFRDKAELLHQCLRSVTEQHFENIEILAVDNDSQCPKTREAIEYWKAKDSRIRFMSYQQEFNYSAINNFAAAKARGDYLLLLNNDISSDGDSGWLKALLEHAQRPDIGAVGGLLLYPDRSVQHAGVIIGIGGIAGHAHKYQPEQENGYFSRPHITHNVSAVTGACLLVKKRHWDLVGGLNECDLKIAFNDVDFCLRLTERGLRNVYTPYCRLIHHESKSRGAEDTAEKISRFNQEISFMRRRHAIAFLKGDFYYNPNLTLKHENFQIREKQWKRVL